MYFLLTTMTKFSKITAFVTILAIVSNIYLYTYPSLNSERCSWSHEYYNYDNLTPYEEYLLKLPYFGDLYKQYFLKEVDVPKNPRDIRMMAIGDPQINGNWPSTPYFKMADNFANDYFLGHIYDTMKNKLEPDYVVLMGDLLSSQWLGDSEFFNRTRRILQRSFKRPEGQSLAEMEIINKHENIDWHKYMNEFYERNNNGTFEDKDFYLFKDVYDWYGGKFIDPKTGYNTEPLFLNITGNHDIGYGDTTFQHMARWMKLYGKTNFIIEYDNDTDHPWRIVMLNSLSLEGPMLQDEFKQYTWKFIKTLEKTPYSGSSILLTHIPMYKRAGLCHDGPNFEYYKESGCHGCSPDRVGLLKSQNHLSEHVSRRVLDAVFGDGKSGIILTGHDHYGCDNYYSFINEEKGWVASKSIDSDKWIREITVRSIMGDYHGNTGIMTGHFNKDSTKWEFDYTECRFNLLHVWWGVHVSSVIAILLITIKFLFGL